MPLNDLLHSLAEEVGEGAVCIILSGTATDGSIGARAIKDAGGLVIVQDPEEAEYDGMPRSAIATGAVDLVLPLAKIPEALASYGGHRYLRAKGAAALSVNGSFEQIIDLLRKLQDERGLSYLFISHDLKVVRALCHRVIVMQNGKIVEQGPVDDVLSHPKTAYTERLVRAAFDVA